MAKKIVDATVIESATEAADNVCNILVPHRNKQIGELTKETFKTMKENWFKFWKRQGMSKEQLEDTWATACAKMLGVPVTTPPRNVYEYLEI
jgi:hypothetical protein